MRIDLRDPAPFRERIFLNAEDAVHRISDREAGMFRGDDPTDGAGPHHLADADGRDIGPALVHPAPHRGVERNIENFDEELAIARLGHRLLGQVPVGPLGKADRPSGEPELTVDGSHDGSSRKRR